MRKIKFKKSKGVPFLWVRCEKEQVIDPAFQSFSQGSPVPGLIFPIVYQLKSGMELEYTAVDFIPLKKL
jgi:hypothetical protein